MIGLGTTKRRPSPHVRPTDGAEALRCVGLAAGYGRLTVVRDVELSVAPGEVVALLGPNGAGKTTLLNAIAGLAERHAGTVSVHGNDVRAERPAEAVRFGIGFVPDDRALFMHLSVRENLEVARASHSPRAESVLEWFPALESRWSVQAGNLSGGEQQMLAVARALLRQPSVLLIDEMSMGLAPIVVESLMPIVRRVADESHTAVVLVEQHVSLALGVADRALVLVHGRVRLEGSAAEIAADPDRLEAAYLGPADESAGPLSLPDPATNPDSAPTPHLKEH